jgi:hypothetical protein
VQPLKPLNVKIGAGESSVTKVVKARVLNAGFQQNVEVAVSNGDCPVGTVAGVDGLPTTQNVTFFDTGQLKKAAITLNIGAAGFSTFNDVTPARCTLEITVGSFEGYPDPVPSNNTAYLEINVFDGNDAEQSALHESFIRSVKPMKITIGDGDANKLKIAKPAAGNGDILPEAEEPGHAINIVAVDGDCPASTVGIADYDKDMLGEQNTVTVAGGKRVSGKLSVTATTAFASGGKKSPARCFATISATGPAGDTDASNNTTKLVIDVYDKNDF